MTTSTPPNSSSLSKSLEELAELRASIEPEMRLWHEASKLMNEMKISEAALKAAQACGPDLNDDPIQGMILDAISDLAVINNISGPEIESMWSTAAEYGRHDLAYNAANEIMFRAKSAAEYTLADRYFQMAINSSAPISLRACAITNSAEIVREGYISGEKNWLGAIELYEGAAKMGLIKAMFNAGNVLLWLVEAGDPRYGERAAAWLQKAIKTIEDGASSIDMGGPDERRQLLQTARMRLAQMHMEGSFKGAEQSQFEKLISHYPSDPYSIWMMKKSKYLRLNQATTKPGALPGDNWVSVLKLLGWKVRTNTVFDFGTYDGVHVIGTRIMISTGDGEGEVIPMIVFNSFAIQGQRLDQLHGSIAIAESEKLGCPVFYASRKAFFVQYNEHDYSILQYANKKKIDITPIWPGSTILEVYGLLHLNVNDRFSPARDDSTNSIPRVINALDEGIQLKGDHLPNAIWLRVGEGFCMPIHRPEEPELIGLESNTRAELMAALESNVDR
jgi:hypothetical protein